MYYKLIIKTMNYITIPATYDYKKWVIILSEEIKIKPLRTTVTFGYENKPDLLDLLKEAKNSKPFTTHEELMSNLMS